jgi:hypothetical protein
LLLPGKSRWRFIAAIRVIRSRFVSTEIAEGTRKADFTCWGFIQSDISRSPASGTNRLFCHAIPLYPKAMEALLWREAGLLPYDDRRTDSLLVEHTEGCLF